jgi:hypothetical protein
MTDTRDAKPRPLVYALFTGIVSGIARAVVDWFLT